MCLTFEKKTKKNTYTQNNRYFIIAINIEEVIIFITNAMILGLPTATEIIQQKFTLTAFLNTWLVRHFFYFGQYWLNVKKSLWGHNLFIPCVLILLMMQIWIMTRFETLSILTEICVKISFLNSDSDGNIQYNRTYQAGKP